MVDKIKSSWWVALFIFASCGFFSLASHKRQTALCALKSQVKMLETEKQLALKCQERLKHQAASQDDPEWIQMLLMKMLGMVPEGQIKIVFEP
ncbi:MAG: hypothetical protein SP1CHLAM54_04910 [Chlamydiia bacterium]|nr:hypothetical protein [Chlamydiia bacterium]MCH9615403.1 hypothetical protein [Chlamydiia bacterium]MCH9628275.1 hypothetical protein [Chlamydiia bacterium]